MSVEPYGIVRTGDVVYTKSPLSTNPYGIIKTNKGKTGIVSTLYAIYHATEKANPYFIQCYFEEKARMNNYIRPLVNKGAKNDMKVTSDNALKGYVIFPKVDEQTKIFDLFEHLDNLITLHQRKYDKLVNVKKALLDKMFPKNGLKIPEIRFKGFFDAWEQRKLGELGSIQTGNTPSTTVKDYYDDNGLLWVTPTDITQNIIHNTERKLSKKGQQVGRVISKNSILCTCIASIGKNAFLPVKCAFNQQINSLTPNENLHNPYFLFTDSYHWSNTMKKGAGGLTFQIVNKTEFSNIITNIPKKIAEENSIGNLFYKLDNLITLHQRECDKLKNIKKSLLERMFV